MNKNNKEQQGNKGTEPKQLRIENCRTEIQEQQAKHEQLKEKEGRTGESS